MSLAFNYEKLVLLRVCNTILKYPGKCFLRQEGGDLIDDVFNVLFRWRTASQKVSWLPENDECSTSNRKLEWFLPSIDTRTATYEFVAEKSLHVLGERSLGEVSRRSETRNEIKYLMKAICRHRASARDESFVVNINGSRLMVNDFKEKKQLCRNHGCLF